MLQHSDNRTWTWIRSSENRLMEVLEESLRHSHSINNCYTGNHVVLLSVGLLVPKLF